MDSLMIGDPFGQPVPPRLRKLFLSARDSESVLSALIDKSRTPQGKAAIRLIRLLSPAAICPLCYGDGCRECGLSGYYSIEQFDRLPEDRIRQIQRFQ